MKSVDEFISKVVEEKGWKARVVCKICDEEIGEVGGDFLTNLVNHFLEEHFEILEQNIQVL